MSKAGGRMTAKRSQPQGFVVADSTFELKIEDFFDVRGKKEIVTDKIQLMELSDATWTIKVNERAISFGQPFSSSADSSDDDDDECTDFTIILLKFPEELKGKAQAVLSVSSGGKMVPINYDEGHEGDSNFSYYSRNSNLKKFIVENAITLNFRLVISCEEVPRLRRKFYDPLAAKKSLMRSVANMFGDPTFSDFTFIVGNREFKVHMAILAAASPVMRRMFTGNLEEAKTKKCTVDAITSEIFDHLLRFIYNADIPKDLNVVAMPLYEAAHYYEIEKLGEICAQEIHESLSANNALQVFGWAQPYDLDLKADAWIVVKRDILKIFVELEDEPLSLESIEAIIKQREQEKKFWKQFERKPVKNNKKTTK